MENKTLKDLEYETEEDGLIVYSPKLRAVAATWAKEDKELIKADKEMPRATRMLLNYLTTKGMRRLDITEGDLK